MDSSFWLGKCVWDTNVVLWQNFGEEILDFYQVMRMGNLDATVHRRLLDRTGRTVPRLRADGPRGPGSDTCA
jgi:hypothetical protein